MYVIVFYLEGIIAIIDAAFEACRRFVPQGSNVYSVLSRGVFLTLGNPFHEDWWENKLQAGTTLALLACLLSACKITEEQLRKVSLERGGKYLIPGIKKVFAGLQKRGIDPLIITTSYPWDASPIADLLNVKKENLFHTKLPPNLTLSHIRSRKMNDTAKWFIEKASTIYRPNLSSGDQDDKIRALMDDFMSQLSNTSSHIWLKNFDIMGGIGKHTNLLRVVSERQGTFDNVLFFGDSSTDMGVADLMTRHRLIGKNTVFVAYNGTQQIVTPQATWGIADPSASAMEPVIDAWLDGGIRAVNDFIKQAPVGRNIETPRYDILYRKHSGSRRLRAIQKHHGKVRRLARGHHTSDLI